MNCQNEIKDIFEASLQIKMGKFYTGNLKGIVKSRRTKKV